MPDGARVENTVVVLPEGYHRIGQGSEFTFPKDAPVPHLSTMAHNTNEMWSLPMSSASLAAAGRLGAEKPAAPKAKAKAAPKKRAGGRRATTRAVAEPVANLAVAAFERRRSRHHVHVTGDHQVERAE